MTSFVKSAKLRTWHHNSVIYHSNYSAHKPSLLARNQNDCHNTKLSITKAKQQQCSDLDCVWHHCEPRKHTHKQDGPLEHDNARLVLKELHDVYTPAQSADSQVEVRLKGKLNFIFIFEDIFYVAFCVAIFVWACI